MTPCVVPGDAISNQTLFIRDVLRAQGTPSEIVVEIMVPEMEKAVHHFSRFTIPEDAGIVFHHSVGSPLTDIVERHPGPKCLIYHNITPAKFFTESRPDVARNMADGLRELERLAPCFPVSAGDSRYNMADLEKHGYANPRYLPIFIDPAKWNTTADPGLMDTLRDKWKNILFVGRISPNKKQGDLIEAFALLLQLQPLSHLYLVGPYDGSDPYYHSLKELIRHKRLGEQVTITGAVSEAQLMAYYRCADLFWSMSEHEGFGVPLIEAMWFNVPVLAYKCTAVPETLAGQAVLYDSKDHPAELAALASLLLTDEELREKVIQAGRARREAFTPDKVLPHLQALLDAMWRQEETGKNE